MRKVLILSSSLKNKGGITTVVKNMLMFNDWDEYKLVHLSTHIEGFLLKKILYLIVSLLIFIFKLTFTKIEIVHIHMSERGSFKRKSIFLKIAKAYKKIVIVHHHGAEFIKEYNKMSAKNKDKVNKFIENVDLNIVLSKLVLKEYKDTFHCENITYVYNGTEITKNNYNNNGNIILFLGRLCERKGMFDLLECIKHLKFFLRDKKYVFYFCGDGEVERFNKFVSDNNIEDCVKYCGWIGPQEKVEIFKNCIINVLPSYNEGLPMTILETMAYGIPNISTKVAAIPEVINKENGILINPGDIDGLITALKELLINCDIRQKFSKNCFQTIVDNFSVDKMNYEIKNCYNKLR